MMALGAGVRQGVVYDGPMQSIDLVPSSGRDHGIFSEAIPRQADQGTVLASCCHAISNPNSSPGIPRGKEAGPWPIWERCNSCRSAFCQACCGKSSNTISSFPQSALRSIKNSPTSALSRLRSSKSGFRRFRNSPSPRSWSSSTGSISRPSLSNSSPRIFGPRTSWMHFGRQRRIRESYLRPPLPSEPLPVRRLGIAVIGQGVHVL